jgi:hypothetical protein
MSPSSSISRMQGFMAVGGDAARGAFEGGFLVVAIPARTVEDMVTLNLFTPQGPNQAARVTVGGWPISALPAGSVDEMSCHD